MGASSGMRVPALSTRWPLTKTSPAMMRAWARVRDSTSSRSTSRRSRRCLVAIVTALQQRNQKIDDEVLLALFVVAVDVGQEVRAALIVDAHGVVLDVHRYLVGEEDGCVFAAFEDAVDVGVLAVELEQGLGHGQGLRHADAAVTVATYRLGEEALVGGVVQVDVFEVGEDDFDKAQGVGAAGEHAHVLPAAAGEDDF